MATPPGDGAPLTPSDPPGAELHPDLARLLRARPSRLSRGISVASNPLLSIAGVTMYVGVAGTGSPWQGVAWAGVAALFCVVVPYLVLFVLIGRGIVADRHVVRREQRLWPHVAALASVLIALAVLHLAGAPESLIVLVTALLANLLVLSAVNRWSKASMHVAGFVAAATTVALHRGGWPLPWEPPQTPVDAGWIGAAGADPRWWAVAAVCTALVGWARVRGGRHSLPQVLLGGTIGFPTSLAVFGVLA